MSLISDIKFAVQLIIERDVPPKELTHQDIQELRPLAGRVHGLATQYKLHRSLPKRKALRKLLNVRDQVGPVQFVSNLNVPGDWDTTQTPRKFMLCVPDEWYDAMAEVLYLAEKIEGESPTKVTKPTKPPGQSARQQLEALLGEDDKAILEVAHSRMPTDDKMRKIFEMDRRCVGWTSQRWAELLDVSDGAIRANAFWKRMRQILRSDPE